MNPAIGRTPAGGLIGGWLLKAHPDVWDVLGALHAGEPILRWPVRPGYRADLMAAGQPVYLWVTRGRRHAEPGVYAVGRLTGPTVDAPDEDGVFRRWAPVELQPLGEPLAAAVLRSDPGWSDAEVVRAPRQGNPMVLLGHHLEVLDRHLG